MHPVAEATQSAITTPAAARDVAARSRSRTCATLCRKSPGSEIARINVILKQWLYQRSTEMCASARTVRPMC